MELSVKDSLKDTAFKPIREFLLRLYYLYEKSPKKYRELKDLIMFLRECLSFGNAGVKPVRYSLFRSKDCQTSMPYPATVLPRRPALA